jgi:hypothetical protein
VFFDTCATAGAAKARIEATATKASFVDWVTKHLPLEAHSIGTSVVKPISAQRLDFITHDQLSCRVVNIQVFLAARKSETVWSFNQDFRFGLGQAPLYTRDPSELTTIGRRRIIFQLGSP